MDFVDIAHENHVDNPGIDSSGVVADEVGGFEVPEAVNHGSYQFIDTRDLSNHGKQLREEGMVGVGAVIDVSAASLGNKVLVSAQVVKLRPDPVGGYSELLGKTAEVGADVGVEEQFYKDLDPSPGRDHTF
ncbi:hypothetical protein [Candidatus Deferrimicrobium sp.]|uniref:hypothetical protein n=1 Tax=Candidatus Deferrimicrobium sp. TaxID=3060586 RepID=UPI003C6ACB38